MSRRLREEEGVRPVGLSSSCRIPDPEETGIPGRRGGPPEDGRVDG